jgi:hypothetical protein
MGSPDGTITDLERAHIAKRVRRTIQDIAKTAFEKDPLVVSGTSLAKH